VNRRQIQLYVSSVLSVLVACVGTWQISTAFAAQPDVAIKHSVTAMAPRPDIFRPGPANRAPIGMPEGPLIDKTSGGATEVASLRTRTSKTLLSRSGFQLFTYTGSINYKDGSGSWQPIDNTLVATRKPGYAYENRANSYSVYLPGSLEAQPIEFRLGTSYVRFSLVGAEAPISIAANTATYAGALVDVDVSLAAENDQLKETLTLSSPAETSFLYSIELSPNVTARPGLLGSIDFVDHSGRTLFGFAPPFMVDASGARSSAVSVQLVADRGALTLALSADSTWLRDPARVFPVSVDPTVTISYSGSSIVKTYTGANQDCYLVSSSPNTSFCGGRSLYVGYTGSAIDRSLLQFNVSIPQDANILEADLALELSHAQSSLATSVSLYTVTSAWTTAASWNKRNGTNSWISPGGDFSTPASWTNTSVGPTLGWYHWYLAPTVQGWVTGSSVNNGLILKTDNEGSANQLTFNSSEAVHSSDWPFLKVIYQLGIGDLAWYRNTSQTLTDHLQLKENLSSGNLLATLQLINIRGTGLNEVFNLNYNILSPNLWDFGRAWITNTGWDQYVDPNMGDGASFFGPTGYAFHYVKNPDGSYITPPGIDADLVHNGDGTWTVKYQTSGEKLNFTSDGLYMISDVDRNGNTISFAYDIHGALASITDTQGRVTTFSYVTGTYTGCAPPTTSGFVSRITDPASRTYSFTYDTNCDLTTYTDPNNKVTTFTYDALFNLIKITDPLGNQTKLTYNAIYKVTSVIRVTNIPAGTGPTTLFTYNSGNTVVTDANNNQSTYIYDTRDRVTQSSDSSGTEYTSYTNDNKHASDKDKLANLTNYTYSASNNLTQVTPPTTAPGQTAAILRANFVAPNQPYLPSSVTDAQGHCRALTYDSAGNLARVYDGQQSPCDGLTGGTALTNAYQGGGTNCGGKLGQLCSTTDGNGHTTSYSYDANGNLVSIAPPSPLGSTTILPDSLSRVARVTDGNGQQTTYSYDSFDRVTQILYAGATTCTSSATCTTYIYDVDGNLTSRVDVTGTTGFLYDSLNRLVNRSLPDTSNACPGSSPMGITVSYDGVGNLASYCDSGGTTTFTYDTANRLIRLAEPGGSCSGTINLCTALAYDADGHRTQITFPGGASLTFSYDPVGHITSAIGRDSSLNVLTSASYTYNLATQDTQLVQTMTEADAVFNGTTTYTYDAFNRLTGASNSQATLTYGYDAAGNRTSDAAGTHSFNAANEVTDAGFSFDANGNQTAGPGSESMSYNAKNQTTSMTAGGATLSGMAYACADQTERTAAGSASFASGPSGLSISKTSGNSTYFIRDSAGILLGQRTPDGNHWYYLKDALGSIVALINGAGSIVANRYGYDPYGKSTYSSVTISNPWGFAGGFLDSTGMVKFGTRYYDPNTGRWTQQDPIAGSIVSPISLNRYAYAADNPINATDESGYLAWWVVLGILLWLGMSASCGIYGIGLVLHWWGYNWWLTATCTIWLWINIIWTLIWLR
jgi:RHS repeat-associated protein